MEQHPIPQQISSYQFKLVGDMTLKQFFQVAGGVIVSLIFYSTSLHPLIKWPIILFSAGLGAAMAFLPFEERPLEKWIIAFFRSIYSPTLFSWKKTDKPPVFYTENAPAPEVKLVQTGPTVEKNTEKLEAAEKSFLQKIGGLFNNNQSSTINNQSVNKTSIPIEQQIIPTTFTTPVSSVPVKDQQPAINTNSAPLSVPQQIPTVITKSAPRIVVEESTPISQQQPLTTKIETQKVEEEPITTNSVEFSIDAAPPSPPLGPNTIVGQVMDQDRKIIEGAILEIKDSSSRPVRALKSNKAGHFIIVTPLSNGKYEVTIEKDGFVFEPVSFEAKGEMIPPIAIKGTKI